MTFIIKRLLQGVIVMLLVASAVFLITRIVTDPALAFLPLNASKQQRIDTLAYLGLNHPLLSQYGHYLWQLLHLNFGDSFFLQGQSAIGLVWSHVPATLLLDSVAIVVALLIAMPLGIIAALRPGSRLDRATTTVSLLGLSAPQFWLGFMLVLIFGVKLNWFPTSGNLQATSIVLPALALALPTAGKIAQLMRSSMIDELDQPYILTARSKGMGGFHRIFHHALRHCLVTVMTQASFEYARMLAGYTVVVEVVFAWPGLGFLTVDALNEQDLVVLQAIVIVTAALIVLVNLITDILYAVIDPRIEATA
ncbi:MAG TPA: ABC transporter permease [Mycobacteriales bacterium]|nr:ABC transporter permease [Mycobacteriales bacterium]